MDENTEVKTFWRFVKTRLTQAEHQGFMLVLQNSEPMARVLTEGNP